MTDLEEAGRQKRVGSYPLTTGGHQCTTACTAGWPAGSKCHCTACGRDFGSITLFDRHRKNDNCLDPSKFETKRGDPICAQDERGVWRTRVTTLEEV